MNKNNSVKLAGENKKMEDRLRVLKEMMSAEKSRRELDGGVYWKSGESGPLNTSRQPPRPSEVKNPAQDKKRPIKVRILTDKNGSSERKLPRCGQCEKASASLNCVECIENYCQVCFSRMHQKGGLSKHHVKPILQKIKHVTPPTKADVPAKPPSSPLGEEKIGGPEPSALLEGTYDEAQSAKTFQEALAEWRNEKPKSCKESETHNLRESFTCTTSEMLTGTSDTAEERRTKLNVEFTDKNQVTYFEKLLMKKYRDGSMTNSQLEKPVEPVASTADENEPTPTISQYNIFYDADLELEGNLQDEACVAQEVVPNIQTVGDLSKCRPSTSFSIEEFNLIIDDGGDNVGTEKTEEVLTMQNGVDTGLRDESCKDERPQTDHEYSSSQDEDDNSHAKIPQGKIPSPDPNSTHNIQHLQQSDILASVKSAWTSCAQSSHGGQELVHFFLHRVDPLDEEESMKLPKAQPQPQPKPQPAISSEGSSDPPQFKLASSLWLPSNSTSLIVEEPEVNIEESAIDLSPALSRPDTRECKDRYYDDTDTDSEPENEREEFISSRLGMTSDSIDMQSRPPSTSHGPDFEEEDRMEQDKADCAALDDLAWELTSTAECEGRLSRCEQDFDSAVTPGPVEEEEEDESRIEVGEVDMTKVISEFELFQKGLMEEDSD